ncbi:flavin reductase family protein [Sphingopyxis sp.]|uniref:flavin reductase family protein n=1 Tax=Sphingopyxis sp. TaxID=1908224 RepID=UPI002D773684|nr:flavin reductase family protein [Sphingopyxis sp.]HET6525169.1 flavin reductase family protein [Sphingopyxis sp.]
MSVSIDSAEFRRILGHYPTGVCAVTANVDGAPVGMVVGSFTSVSLDPPLVAFFPDRKSTTWPKIETAGRFCVNVLSHNQRAVCQALSSKAENKFESVAHRTSDLGQPIIEESVAWIDCDLEAVHEAGDHFIVIGRVRSLDVAHSGDPLLFLKGGYGQFAAIVESE